jgi:hypothetical protein
MVSFPRGKFDGVDPRFLIFSVKIVSNLIGSVGLLISEFQKSGCDGADKIAVGAFTRTLEAADGAIQGLRFRAAGVVHCNQVLSSSLGEFITARTLRKRCFDSGAIHAYHCFAPTFNETYDIGLRLQAADLLDEAVSPPVKRDNRKVRGANSQNLH